MMSRTSIVATTPAILGKSCLRRVGRGRPVGLRRPRSRWIVHVGVASVVLAGAAPARTAGAQESGSITGRIVDAATQAPLEAANVSVDGIGRAALTSSVGAFGITGIPAGSYVLRVFALGYAPVALTDVIVSPGRGTQVMVELQVQALSVEGIVVNAEHFRVEQAHPVSTFRLNREEIRRAPGSVGDVSRVLTALPSMAQVSDNANDLYVRGGSPFENGFFVDQVEVPNINHFPAMGSTGGAIGLWNVDRI